MNDVVTYLASNIPLFSILAVIYYLALKNIRIKRQESLLFISFATIVLFLSVVVYIEKYAQKVDWPIVGTIFTSIGYVTRPILLYVFILLTNMGKARTKKFYVLLGVPLVIDIIVYFFPLLFNVPFVSTMVFYYKSNGDGTASFVRGTFLNFTSHAVSLFYLGMLVYVSAIRFKGKHRRDGFVIILCVLIILVTVSVEMIVNRNDLLNIVCAICCLINYIFILSVSTSRDPLTNLYDRRTYYEDIARYKDIINGIIQIDMNELKFVNDNFGHKVGDSALYELAQIFEACVDPASMCVYRMSGDEFLILMFRGKEEWLSDTVFMIKEELKTSKYSAAVGYYFFDKSKEIISFEDAMRKAEQYMYKDKNEYYKQSGHDRRKD